MAKIKDIYAHVTNKIISELENNIRPWMKPWNAEHAAGRITRPLRHNGLPYNGINILMLWTAALDAGYSSPYWLTYKQTKALGAQVRKGERSTLVVYANTFTRTEENADGEQEAQTIPFLKSYNVFNADQIDGLPEHYTALAEPVRDPVQRIEHADHFFANTGAHIQHGGNRAYYRISTDHIQIPPFEAFHDAQSYVATLAHEITHWTRHPSRLDRHFDHQKFGDEGYAREELVAELGAAFLSADLGITPEIRDDHAPYIASWLKVLKEDKRAIFSAAAHAQRAIDHLHSLQKQETLTGTAL
ncbi:MAG: zincin-like metallopeptidase domain-containing protein [Gammaproteobacteria bacterium]|nr:zincin-like metallopeptidase domain-containing protein [Gammaproteobacteria bacterium]